MGVRASIWKPTPFKYLAFEKTDQFIYLLIQNVDLFIYCPLIFCTHLLLVVRQISQSVHWIPREQAASKSLLANNMCIYQVYTRLSEKWGLSHRNPEKSGHSYTFNWKKGPIIYLAALKNGAIRQAHPYYAIYRKLPPPPPPHTHTHTPSLSLEGRWASTNDGAKILLLSLLSIALNESPNPKHVHSLIFSEA